MNESTKKLLTSKYMLLLLGGVILLIILIVIAYVTSSSPTNSTNTTSNNNSNQTITTTAPISSSDSTDNASAYFSKTTVKVQPNNVYSVDLIIKKTTSVAIQGYETSINFDKTKISITGISVKTGVASIGLSDTNDNLTTVNSKGTIKLLSEIQSASGYTIPANTEVTLATITFKPLTTTATKITLSSTANSYLYVINSKNEITKSAVTVQGSVDIVP